MKPEKELIEYALNKILEKPEKENIKETIGNLILFIKCGAMVEAAERILEKNAKVNRRRDDIRSVFL